MRSARYRSTNMAGVFAIRAACSERLRAVLMKLKENQVRKKQDRRVAREEEVTSNEDDDIDPLLSKINQPNTKFSEKEITELELQKVQRQKAALNEAGPEEANDEGKTAWDLRIQEVEAQEDRRKAKLVH